MMLMRPRRAAKARGVSTEMIGSLRREKPPGRDTGRLLVRLPVPADSGSAAMWDKVATAWLTDR